MAGVWAMKAIITGAAGFIGFHAAMRLLHDGWQIINADNLNSYYDVSLKEARLEDKGGFRFARADIADAAALQAAIGRDIDADIIIHLAAQAGVRYSAENPFCYVSSNITGMVTVFEQALQMPARPPVMYASSSSVYGDNSTLPFAETDRVDRPVSVYTATKRASELFAFSYSCVHGLRSTGLRFLTDAILAQRAIRLYNHGHMKRDFTYIDDITAGIAGAAKRLLDRDASCEIHPMPSADVLCTYADIRLAGRDLGFRPATTVEKGMQAFVDRFREFYGR